jgi:hypothetical protein
MRWPPRRHVLLQARGRHPARNDGAQRVEEGPHHGAELLAPLAEKLIITALN